MSLDVTATLKDKKEKDLEMMLCMLDYFDNASDDNFSLMIFARIDNTLCIL